MCVCIYIYNIYLYIYISIYIYLSIYIYIYIYIYILLEIRNHAQLVQLLIPTHVYIPTYRKVAFHIVNTFIIAYGYVPNNLLLLLLKKY